MWKISTSIRILLLGVVFASPASAAIFGTPFCQVYEYAGYTQLQTTTIANSPSDEFVASHLGVKARFYIQNASGRQQVTQTDWYEDELTQTPMGVVWVAYGVYEGFHQLQPGEHCYTEATPV